MSNPQADSTFNAFPEEKLNYSDDLGVVREICDLSDRTLSLQFTSVPAARIPQTDGTPEIVRYLAVRLTEHKPNVQPINIFMIDLYLHQDFTAKIDVRVGKGTYDGGDLRELKLLPEYFVFATIVADLLRQDKASEINELWRDLKTLYRHKFRRLKGFNGVQEVGPKQQVVRTQRGTKVVHQSVLSGSNIGGDLIMGDTIMTQVNNGNATGHQTVVNQHTTNGVNINADNVGGVVIGQVFKDDIEVQNNVINM